ncbi:uncharacterized protein GGS25DRAFT_430495 [Hypoxylon fragiforme]|uniref:uncharacterized protein n=1 Tax=Hypoxylon fragiforme TaxID=63214 RepID=UPI0020C5EF05|nr:uncharacterized protein GGS25DRAFT_430495 [Hypoxylon fragiforme]KAI2605439.1 hypothetical protein GGS25DRAFT_430495 [Hypoxylon fragiforme]
MGLNFTTTTTTTTPSVIAAAIGSGVGADQVNPHPPPSPPTLVWRQVTLTQTITYPDATTTAIVTLDRGSPPTSSSSSPTSPPLTTSTTPPWPAGASPPSSPSSSDGLSGQQIGIIVGVCVGAFVVGLVLWCCCTRRCGCTRYSVYSPSNSDNDDGERDYYAEVTIQQQQQEQEQAPPTMPMRTAWRFPWSIPPPLVPTYVARDDGPRWTANQAARLGGRRGYWGG